MPREMPAELIDMLKRQADHYADELAFSLAQYERTGDHDHGAGKTNAEICPGGDCVARKAYLAIVALRKLNSF